jgi:RNA recognition motif-containing protein
MNKIKYDESINNSVNFNKLHHQYQQQQLNARQHQHMGQPSRTIMLRQLPIQMDDVELRNQLNLLAVPCKDMRLVKHRDTGVSRGFAFVEFNSVDEAQQWMHMTQVYLASFYGFKVIFIILLICLNLKKGMDHI